MMNSSFHLTEESFHEKRQHRTIQDMSMDLHDILQEMQGGEEKDDYCWSDSNIGSISMGSNSDSCCKSQNEQPYDMCYINSLD
jgi:hypothetical protein